MSTTADLPVDGLKYEDYIEVEGETFHATASGPSFFNGLGIFKLTHINGGARISGSIATDGSLSIAAKGMNSPMGVAFGEMCASASFNDVVDAVQRGR